MEHLCWGEGNIRSENHMQPASLFHTVLLLPSGIKGSLQMCSTNLYILPVRKIPVSLFQSFVWAAARNALLSDDSATQGTARPREFLLIVYILCEERDFSYHLCCRRSCALRSNAGAASERVLSDQGDK